MEKDINRLKVVLAEKKRTNKWFLDVLKELYTTGVPIPFECQFACRVKKTDCVKIEKALHTAFEPQRINANREFFRINVGQAMVV